MLSQPSTLKYQAMSCICFKSIILPFETETLLCAAITEEGNTANPLWLAVCIIPPAAAAGTSFLLHIIPGGISTVLSHHGIGYRYPPPIYIIYTDDGTAIYARDE